MKRQVLRLFFQSGLAALLIGNRCNCISLNKNDKYIPDMLSYADLKHKTLMAMTSLKPSEFEELLLHFTAAWQEKAGTHPSKGGRPPTIGPWPTAFRQHP